jgi:PAS domain S-box-containing protein
MSANAPLSMRCGQEYDGLRLGFQCSSRCPAGEPTATGHRRDGPITELGRRVASLRPGESSGRAGAARDRLALAAILAWCTVVALIDAFVVSGAVLIGLLITGPLLAAIYASSRTTAIAAGYAAVLGVLLGLPDHMFLTADHVIRVLILVIGSGLAIWLARTNERLRAARSRHALLSDAGEVLGSALDYEVTLIGLARLCANRLADWCFVFGKEDDGSLRQVAAAHADAGRQRQAWELLLRYPLDAGRTVGPASVIRSGEAQLVPDVTDDLLEALAADGENLRLLRALDLRSAMVVPLSVREHTLGAIALASTPESGRVYGPADLALAQELGARAAVAVDNARLYGRLHQTESELRVSRDQLEAILDGVADAVTAQAPDGRLVYANDAAARSLGFSSSEELLQAGPAEFMHRYRMYDENGDAFPFERLPGRQALAGEEPVPALVRYHSVESGDDFWSLIKATAIRDPSGVPLLAINVIEDVTEQRERELQLRFLAETGRALSSSLDWEETFPEIARLAAGTLADWCAIEVLEDDGAVRLAAFAHRDPDKQRLGDGLARKHPPSARLRGALASGRSELRVELSDEEVAAAGRDPESLIALLELGLRSALAVPMIARGKVVGAISMVSGDDSRRFREDDLVLAEELARRCALALDNARLFRERSRIARTLQESLLPPMLPELPGLDLAARFRAAGEGLEVGGDFYDLFETGDSGWAVAIGDVCGKGSEAAAITALARYTVRAAAMRHGGEPSQILGVLNEALLRQRTDRRFCTVLYGRLEANGAGHKFEFASGGHPLPLMLRSGDGDGDGDGGGGGSSGEVGSPGTLLGIVPDPSLSDSRVVLKPGEALVLYTDGVTDSAAPERIWTAAELVEAVGSPAGLDADTIAERVMRAALSEARGEPRDDIAILVLKVPD